MASETGSSPGRPRRRWVCSRPSDAHLESPAGDSHAFDDARDPSAMRRLKTAGLALSAVLLLAGPTARVAGETFLVDHEIDAVDLTPGDGGCLAIVGSIPDFPFVEFGCTLRAAIQEANASPGPDIVSLDAGVYELTLTGAESSLEVLDGVGDLDVTESLELVAAESGVVVTTTNPHRLVHVTSASLAVRDVELAGGDTVASGHGGCVYSSDSELALEGVVVRSCSGQAGGGVSVAGTGGLTLSDSRLEDNEGWSGGGLFCGAECRLIRSAVTGNRAVPSLGSQGLGGGLAVRALVELFHVTVSGNVAGGSGGGIHVYAGELDAVASTIAYNESAAGNGAGIHVHDDSGGSGSARLRNTIVAWNRETGSAEAADCGSNAEAVLESDGYNVLGSTGCQDLMTVSMGLPTDRYGLPNLGPLVFIGGPTPAHPPNPGSVLIDGGSPDSCLDVDVDDLDQRSLPRPVDGGSGSAVCDVGSVEIQAGDAWIFGDPFESGDLGAWSSTTP